jgi:hypothetical protein
MEQMQQSCRYRRLLQHIFRLQDPLIQTGEGYIARPRPTETKEQKTSGQTQAQLNVATTQNNMKKKHAVQHNVSDCDNCSSLRSWTDSLSKLAAFSSRMPETDSHRLFKSD